MTGKMLFFCRHLRKVSYKKRVCPADLVELSKNELFALDFWSLC